MSTPPPAAADPGKEAPAPTPPPPELVPAHAAFERGDFKTAIGLTRAVLAASPSPEVESAARDLLERMAPDPWAIRLGIAALALLALVAGLYIR